MVDTESERLRETLREVKRLIGDAIGKTVRMTPGDRKATMRLQEAYGIVAVLLQELETGNWPGRDVVNH